MAGQAVPAGSAGDHVPDHALLKTRQHTWACEGSTLRWPVTTGAWPRSIVTRLDGQETRLALVFRNHEAATYRTDDRLLTVVVFND